MKKLLFMGITAMFMACDNQLPESFNFDEMTYSPSETVFKLFAPKEAQCLVVVGDLSVSMAPTTIPVDEGVIWTATVKGDLKGKTYEFVVDGQSSPGVFAKAVTVNGQKGVIVDLRDTDPEGWATDSICKQIVNGKSVNRRFNDWVVYEMHHRDFSVARPEAKYPGKFMALTEPWALDHLTDLGINAVHILPSYDYGSVDETRLNEPQYNWGYDPVNYNVPDGSYSTDPTDPTCRIREFKQMVKALHEKGIAVVLDVVYNHTFNIDNSNFQRTFPDYYYRKNADGTYSNGSGCGNETASEKPMMREFMIESVKYWIKEYHIDGFRFDLMGVHDIETMKAIRAAADEINPDIFIYGEGWSAGGCALPGEQLAMKANIPQMPGIAAFSDDIRDALRGPFSDDTKPGWLGLACTPGNKAEMAGLKESLKAGIAGMIEHPQVDYSLVNYSKEPYALEPTQMMSYVSCHDDMCLVDRLCASIKGIDDLRINDLRFNSNGAAQIVNRKSVNSKLVALDLLAQTAVFTSQGVPFMLSGEELLRTKLGVHNSYESPDSINQLDWSNKERYPEVFAYYKNLIALRKHHPAFRLGDAELVRQHLEFLPSDDCVLSFRLKDNAGGDEWKDIIVILNPSREQRKVEVPQGTYTIVCADGRIDENGMGTTEGNRLTVAPMSALIVHD